MTPLGHPALDVGGTRTDHAQRAASCSRWQCSEPPEPGRPWCAPHDPLPVAEHAAFAARQADRAAELAKLKAALEADWARLLADRASDWRNNTQSAESRALSRNAGIRASRVISGTTLRVDFETEVR
jgi:hypothetical protein